MFFIYDIVSNQTMYVLAKEVATLVPIVVQPTCTKCLPAKLKLYTDILVLCYSAMDDETVIWESILMSIGLQSKGLTTLFLKFRSVFLVVINWYVSLFTALGTQSTFMHKSNKQKRISMFVYK